MSVLIYFFVFFVVSIFAKKYVKNLDDYCFAKKKVGIVIATSFIVLGWFDADNLLGTPAVFLEKGFSGIYADPFGSAFCLIMIGLVFGRKFYQSSSLSIAAIYRKNFSAGVTNINTLAIIFSYIGWITSQVMGLGIVLSHMSHHAISATTGSLIATLLLAIPILAGNIWETTLATVPQFAILIVTLICVFISLSHEAGGVTHVLMQAQKNALFNFLPDHSLSGISHCFTEILVVTFGLLPQQDLFQRIRCNKSEKAMRWSFVLAGTLFLVLSFLPILITYTGQLLHTPMSINPHLYILSVVCENTSTFTQTVFLGAIFTALMGSCSPAFLAPAIMLSELCPQQWQKTEKDKWRLIRYLIVIIACLSCVAMTLGSGSIYNMLIGSMKVSLVVAFIPLVSAMYWKKANTTGGYAAIALGITGWLFGTIFPCSFDPELIAITTAAMGMIVGSHITIVRQKWTNNLLSTLWLTARTTANKKENVLG